MLRLSAIALAILLATIALGELQAAREPATVDPAEPRREVVVFEARGCRYCPLLRDDVRALTSDLPRQTAPSVRYVTVGEEDERLKALAETVTIVPTLVLLVDGEETDRLTGYHGPRTLAWLLAGRLTRGE